MMGNLILTENFNAIFLNIIFLGDKFHFLATYTERKYSNKP